MMSTRASTPAQSERGIALVLTLFLLSALSVLAASLMFLSQTETYASTNYRTMSQARYGAEAGVHKAINFLLDPAQYAGIGSAGDPLGAYTRTVSPVTYNNQPVVLSAMSAQASNYPVAAVQTAFNNAAKGSLAAGRAAVQYSAYATLLAVRVYQQYGGGTGVVQSWQITADGSVAGSRTATVEVTAILEIPIVAAHTYAAFATDNGCGALTFSGNTTIDSYDSSHLTLSGGQPVTQDSGGNVGTNGNLTVGGSVDVRGSLSTPRTGVGACHDGSVDALTESGHADVEGGLIQLPQAVQLQAPPAPSPAPPTTNVAVNSSTTCAAFGLSAPATCSGANGTFTIDAHGSQVSFGNLSLSGGALLTLVGGTPAVQYSVNSLALSGNSQIAISGGKVLLDVAGQGQATPIDFTGGSFVNSTATPFDASMLQILYAGSGNIVMTGNSGSSAIVYAPNAAVSLAGTADFYGSLIGHTVTNTGNGNIHYDRHLGNDFFVSGNPILSTFSWKKY